MSHPFSPRLVPAVATLVGIAFILAAAGMAVSHLIYGEPVHRRHTREPVSSPAVAFTVILFGSAGCLVAGLGIRALRKRPRRSEDEADE